MKRIINALNSLCAINRINDVKTYVSSFTVSMPMQILKLKGVHRKKQPANTMNISTSTETMSNGSIDLSSFLPTIEVETSEDDWSSTNDASDHFNNLLPDLFSDFDLSLPNSNSSHKDLSDNEIVFPDFDLSDFSLPDLSSSINSTSNAKNVANKASKSEELDLELDELFKELGFDNLDFAVETNGTNDIGKNDTNLIDKWITEIHTGLDTQRVADPAYYTLIFLYAFVIGLGIAGNLMILWAILSKSAMRTARNYFIVSLAVSDLLLCVMSMPLSLWEILSGKWPFGLERQWLCQLSLSCKDVPVFLSSMAIVAIAVDRYRCIMQPERPHFSPRAAMFISFLMMVTSVLLTVPKFVTAQVKDMLKNNSMKIVEQSLIVCSDQWDETFGESTQIVYKTAKSCIQFVLPVLLVFTLYVSIYVKLKNRPQSMHAENVEKRRRTNVMISSIAVVFFVSWLPLNVFDLLMKLVPEILTKAISGNETVIYALLQLFGMCTALANPILYGYLNENFRKEYNSIYRQMPWYTAGKDEPMEVALRYQITMKKHADDGSESEEGIKSQPAVVTIDNYNNVNIVGPSWITQRLMFAAAAAANTSARETNFEDGDNENGDYEKDDIPDAATRQAQVAATAAAFLKSMDEDELLQVVPEEVLMVHPSPQHKNDCDKNDNSEHSVNQRRSQNIEMNQIHDDLYRQLTGEGGNEPIIQMEYKKKPSKERKEKRKNGLRKTFSFRPSTESNGYLDHKEVYRNGKRHSAVPSTFSDIHFTTPTKSIPSTSSVNLQQHPITNGQPHFCDSFEKKKTQINHQVSQESYNHTTDTESKHKYQKLQKMFSLPYGSTTARNEKEDINSSKLSPYLENVHHLSDHKPLEAASLSVPIGCMSEKNESKNWHNKTFRSVSLWKGSTDKSSRKNTMRINNNSTTKEPECDNAESQHEDNKAKKTYNNNFNNNNNHMATTEDDTSSHVCNRKENCVMTTMVMSSAIKPSDVIGVGKQSRIKGKLQQQENQEMQWVFLTTTKRRSSVQEQKLVRVDSKNSHNATCLRTENELKAKYSEKWLNNSRNKKGGLSRGSDNNRTAASEKFGLKRDRMLSLRLPRRQQSMKESYLSPKTADTNNISDNLSTHSSNTDGMDRLNRQNSVPCKNTSSSDVKVLSVQYFELFDNSSALPTVHETKNIAHPSTDLATSNRCNGAIKNKTDLLPNNKHNVLEVATVLEEHKTGNTNLSHKNSCSTRRHFPTLSGSKKKQKEMNGVSKDLVNNGTALRCSPKKFTLRRHPPEDFDDPILQPLHTINDNDKVSCIPSYYSEMKPNRCEKKHGSLSIGHRWKVATTNVKNQKSREKLNAQNIGNGYFSQKLIPLFSSTNKSASTTRHPVELEGLEETAV